MISPNKSVYVHFLKLFSLSPINFYSSTTSFWYEETYLYPWRKALTIRGPNYIPARLFLPKLNLTQRKIRILNMKFMVHIEFLHIFISTLISLESYIFNPRNYPIVSVNPSCFPMKLWILSTHMKGPPTVNFNKRLLQHHNVLVSS